jgi:hypothetical protein
MTIEEFFEVYGGLDMYLDYVLEEHGDKVKVSADFIEVPVKVLNDRIKIHTSQLDLLCNGQMPDRIPNFNYIGTFGIRFKNYYEIRIAFKSDDYGWHDGDEWSQDPLKFKVGNTQFEVGVFSSLMVLLTEPLFRESDYHYDFEKFASIKILIENDLSYESEFVKGLYYLNSHYLKPIGFYAEIQSVELVINDPLGLYADENAEAVFAVARRKRNLKRKDFQSCEPLKLYNFASSVTGEQRFLSYYRVLEFFMEQAVLLQIQRIRYDSSVTEKELQNLVSLRQEEPQLLNLLKTILTPSRKKKLINYCIKNRLIEAHKIEKVSSELYGFRNSVVHAKQKEMSKTIFPNPFEENYKLNRWIYVVSELSQECIAKLNTVKSTEH